MKRRRLGLSGPTVSEIGFGCGTTAGLMVEGSARERRQAVRHALAHGIDYFDTAPVYGAGRSEERLGETLGQLGARPFVASKVALEQGDWGDIAGAVVASVERSVERLGRPVDLIQLHNRVSPHRAARAPFGSGALLTVSDVLGAGGVLEAFEAVRARGLARCFGLSSYGGDPGCVRQLVDSGRFHALVVSYSAINPSAFEPPPPPPLLRDYAGIGSHGSGRGLGVVALRVLEAGLMATNQPARPDGNEQERMACLAPAVRRVMESHGIDPVEGAIRFALQRAEVSTVLVGFSNLSQIETAARASSGAGLPRALLDDLAQLHGKMR